MKKNKILALALAFFTGFACAQSLPVIPGNIMNALSGLSNQALMPLNLTAADGTVVTIQVPADVIQIAAPHMTEINMALAANGITAEKIKSVEGDIQSAYKNIRRYISTDSPYTTVTNSISQFTDELFKAIPNAQSQQQVYANAWIGSLIPGAHFGLGVNAGAAALDATPLKAAAKALDIDTKDLPDTIAFPTVAVDARIGGFILPFDIGITALTFDTTRISSLDDAIKPSSIEYFAIGGDIRYAIIKGGQFRPRVSIGAGVYYTKGSAKIEDTEKVLKRANADLDFSTRTYMLETQASIKLLFFTPFIGGKLLFSNSSLTWNAHANWNNIIAGAGDSYQYGVSQAMAWGILPTDFGDSYSQSMVHPQIFGGFGLDLFILTATVSMSYDFATKTPAAATSIRIAW